jgi:guanine deaminase
MLIAGQLLLQSVGSPGRCRIAAGTVRLRNGVIEEVCEGDLPRSYDLGGHDCLITPGFIDAHLHLPQFDIIGAHGMPLLTWLEEVVFPAEINWRDCSFAAAMTTRAVKQCLAHGTTAFCAYASVHDDSTAAALRIAADTGMRGVIGQVLMDCGAPAELCRSANQLIDQSARLLDQFPPGSRIAAAVTPRFALSCSAELLSAAGQLAGQRGAIVQTHLAETVAECELVCDRFDGQSYVDVYRTAGLLGPRSILGHGIYLEAADRSQLAASGSTIAHCPTANAFLQSGTMRRNQLLSDGVGISLGSDIGAGYERSMVRVARAMIEAASLMGDPYPDAATAWHMITAGNAERLGWKTAGQLFPGADADLVIIRPDIPWLQPPVDPLARLLFAWDDRWIERTLLRGRVCFPAQ